MNFKVISCVDGENKSGTEIIPEKVTGSMNVFGGKVAGLVINAGGNIKKIGYFIARMSNLMSENKFVLELPPKIRGEISRFLINDAQQVVAAPGSIGIRSDQPIQFFSSNSTEIKEDAIHRRVISSNLIKDDADISIIASFGATNFRLMLVNKNGTIIARKDILTKLTDIRKKIISEFDDLLSNIKLTEAEHGRICGIVDAVIQNLAAKKDQYDGLADDDISFLQSVQLKRVDQVIEELISKFIDEENKTKTEDTKETVDGFMKKRIRGFAFTIAGNIHMDTGVIRSNGVEGIKHLNIVDYYEKRYGIPVSPQNDVDCEIAALVGKLIDIQHHPETPGYSEFMRIAEEIKNDSSRIITGYGGGTGIGGCQIKVSRDISGNLSMELLLGREQSAGEYGHNEMDRAIPEFDNIVRKSIEQGMPESFINDMLAFHQSIPCRWCGNGLDFEKLGGGTSLDNIAPWLYQQIKEDKDMEKFKEIIRSNSGFDRSKLGTEQEETDYIKNARAKEIVAFYKATKNQETEDVLKFMAKVWAANFVIMYNDGLQVEIDGKAQDWSTFFITQGMFRKGNEFFREMLMDSLAKDFEEANYTEKFSFIIDYNDDNQTTGAAQLLSWDIEKNKEV
ncbi:MAG: hypothetical protein DKM50_03200 [Candidatus Margulisiibacteriota bacterium]|nr:MAG: hypothetical protein A2X43_09695 [Candidatus Margulisbacteria bacterium GWD2_39_127]OGI04602.1 MAG: hypothetical protein A2X42_07835 [Candidatus Margulisbacteria bacterium GWF2_38_17]OGI11866.1 MAG: hypothetical protein A2X41_11435 [Candidatus Margulisbacteria bacterium GWE2_39_32]PZM83123.1 MAG: hypothetical protein DKM50_03200 [Candidatus Margulisiibacteriota bacterium]HAR62208.1 hypothetical protein [Candidatus Margulisiibacteriota bacterium]